MSNNQSDPGVRVRLEKELKQRLDAMLLDRKITQQDAVVALVEWIVQQDPIVQLVVLGQAPPTKDILNLIVDQLRNRGSPAETSAKA